MFASYSSWCTVLGIVIISRTTTTTTADTTTTTTTAAVITSTIGSTMTSTDGTGLEIDAIVAIVIGAIVIVVGLVLLFVFRSKLCSCCNSKSGPPTETPAYISDTVPKSTSNPYSTVSTIKIAEEFRSLDDLPRSSRPTDEGSKPQNQARNRYRDIIPFDYNRVTISNGNYINASLVEKQFIATQDPQPMEDSDFWCMVWEHNVRAIVRLSTDAEGVAVDNDNNQAMCAVYLPTSKWVTDDHVTLEKVDCSSKPLFTKTIIKMDKDRQSRDLYHYHVQQWKSESFPSFADTIATIREIQDQLHLADKLRTAKILVHCGAGSGRIGVFIALWIIIENLKTGDEQNILKICKRLRHQRLGMVNTKKQYEYIYQCAASCHPPLSGSETV